MTDPKTATGQSNESFAAAATDALDKLQDGEFIEAEVTRAVISRGGVVGGTTYFVTLKHLQG